MLIISCAEFTRKYLFNCRQYQRLGSRHRSNWNQLSVIDKTDPSAFIGLMNFYVEKNDFVSAKKMVAEGISRQPASADLDQLATKLSVTGHSLW